MRGNGSKRRRFGFLVQHDQHRYSARNSAPSSRPWSLCRLECEYREMRDRLLQRERQSAPATPVRLSICTLPTLSLNTQTPLSQPTSVIASVTTAVTAATISVSNAIRSDLHSTYNGRLSARGAKSRCVHMPLRPHADAPTCRRARAGGGGGTTDQRSPMAKWFGD